LFKDSVVLEKPIFDLDCFSQKSFLKSEHGCDLSFNVENLGLLDTSNGGVSTLRIVDKDGNRVAERLIFLLGNNHINVQAFTK
jgi:hypothetical protein